MFNFGKISIWYTWYTVCMIISTMVKYTYITLYYRFNHGKINKGQLVYYLCDSHMAKYLNTVTRVTVSYKILLLTKGPNICFPSYQLLVCCPVSLYRTLWGRPLSHFCHSHWVVSCDKVFLYMYNEKLVLDLSQIWNQGNLEKSKRSHNAGIHVSYI